MILLPILSEGEVVPPTDPKRMLILREVISELYEDLDNKKLNEKERFALLAVIANYQGRIQTLFNNSMPESAQQEFQEIQALIISVERDGLDESFRRHQINSGAYRLYSRFISNVSESVTKQMLSLLSFWLSCIQKCFGNVGKSVKRRLITKIFQLLEKSLFAIVKLFWIVWKIYGMFMMKT
jgi:CPA1 family monovalent cation:H+ antiporter